MKRPLYDNAKLQAPDGELLCVCDSRKAAWYVTKGLGKFRFAFDTLFPRWDCFCDSLLHIVMVILSISAKLESGRPGTPGTCAKCQIVSEQNCGALNFPEKQQNYCKDVCSNL